MENNVLGTKSVKELFIKLSVPAVVAQIVNLAYNMVDRMYIGHLAGIGPTALTGVGVTMPIIMLISAFSSLIGMGGSPRASIKMGENKYDEAEQILGTSFSILVLISIILTAIILIFKTPLLYLFGASENTIIYGDQYLTIYAIGTIFVQLTLGLNPYISAQGFSKESMMTVVIGAIINIVLDPILMFGFNMGVSGAALATIISQAVSAIYVMKFLLGKKTNLRIKKEYLKIDWKLVAVIVSLGLSPFIMQSTESLLQLTFNKSLLSYGGDLYVGAMSIISTVMMLVALPLTGFAQGAQPITSYNYGAQRYDRVMESISVLLKVAFTYTIIFFIIIMFVPGIFIGMFTSDPVLTEATKYAIRIYMGGIFMLGVQMACQQSFISLGQAKTSIKLALLRKIVLLIPLILILPNFLANKVFAVFLAEPVADIIASITTIVTFKNYVDKNITNRIKA